MKIYLLVATCYTTTKLVNPPILYSVKEIIPPDNTETVQSENTQAELATENIEPVTRQTIESVIQTLESAESKETGIVGSSTEQTLNNTVTSITERDDGNNKTIENNSTTMNVADGETSNTTEILENDPSKQEHALAEPENLDSFDDLPGNSTDIPFNQDGAEEIARDEDLVVIEHTENASEKKENITIEIPKKKTGFNYASFDCGALILGSNKEAKYPKAVLLNSKDEYMLSPCDAKKYVEIELCQNILVNSISLANFEYFSSMFKDFKLYGSSKLPEWKLLGSFQAKNVRDKQVFNLDDPVLWTKYVRIEFDTYYGSEYYCPVTSVQVFGISMMEQAQDLEQELDKLNTTEIIIPEVKSLARPELPFNDVCINEEKPKEKQNNIFTKIIKRLNQLEQTTSNLDLYFLELSYSVKRNSKSLSENRFQEQINQFELKMNEKLNEKSRELEEKMVQIQSLMESLNNELRWTQFWNKVLFFICLVLAKYYFGSVSRENNIPTTEIVNKTEVKEKVEYVIKEVTEKIAEEEKTDDEKKRSKKKKAKLL
ncbi:hypothetical protein HDV06_004438 [Boothiomyces sp. JEL0866]|nr:hypothetical protein HDV06_004438 [Boothiomyces sp. JEL0866]